MPRILELFGEPVSSGGQESYVVSQLTHMDRTGLSFDFLTPYYCDSDAKRETLDSWDGVIYELGLPFKPGQSREFIFEHIERFLREHVYDVVHVHSGSTTFLGIAAEAAKKTGVRRVIVHSHSPVVPMKTKNRIIRMVAGRRMAKCVDVYCACSRNAAETKYLPKVWGNVLLLNNGIDLNQFCFREEQRREVRETLGVGDRTKVIGQVGRMDIPKNQAFTIEVFSEYHKQNPDSVLWLVGDGPDKTDLMRLAETHGLSDTVRFLGARGDVDQLLQGMDCFLLPSFWEGSPIALHEAFATGLYCLVSDCIPADSVPNSEYIVRMPLNAASVWAETLSRDVSRNIGAADEMARAGFDVEATAAKLRQIYTSTDSVLKK